MPFIDHYDVIVIGAGAAGLLAATRSAERGRHTLLLEKNRKSGVKILMSGGTRCNITHDCDAAGIIAAFGSAGLFLHSPLAALSPQNLLDLLHAEGLATKVEPGGKVFPQTDRAADVLNALLRRLRRSGAQLALGEPVKSISQNPPLPSGEGRVARNSPWRGEGDPPDKDLSQNRRGLAGHHRRDGRAESAEPNVPVPLAADDFGIGPKITVAHGRLTAPAFQIATSRRTLQCDRLIVTTGGKSYSGCGTTGDGYPWLDELGHTIRRPRPALVPLTSDESWIHDLAGITVADVQLQVIDVAAVTTESVSQKGRRRGKTLPPGVLLERRGSLLFTHFGLSGPAALDVSRAVTAAAKPLDVALNVDFLPSRSINELEQCFRNVAASEGKRLIATVVAEWIPRRLVDALILRANVPPDRRAAELSVSERTRLVEQLKRCLIRVTGTRGFEKAEVTAGGVALDEVDSRTMQSKLVPGLYLAGEILDLDGFIGGYNFQAAFSTGYLAGQSV